MSSTSLRREWTLKRNCSASPNQFALVLGLLALASILLGAILAIWGAWWVLLFSGIEVAALIVAFVAYARHAGDFERVVMTPDALIIEFNSGNHIFRSETHPSSTRVEYPCPRLAEQGEGALIGILSAGAKVCGVGRFVPVSERARLAQEMRLQLSVASRGGGL